MAKYRELYDRIDFTDRETIKQLLYFRAQFEQTRFNSQGSAYNRVQIKHDFYTDLIDIYADLDELIKETELTNKNLRLLRLVMSGYTINYIYSNFENYKQEATIKMFNRTLDKITETQKKKEAEEDEATTPERGGANS